MNDYYDQTPEQRRQLRAQRNRRRQAQVRRRKLLLGLLVLAVLAVVLILVLRGCGKGKEPAQPTPSENVDKPDTPNTPAEPSDKEPNQKPDDQQSGQRQEIPWNLTLVNRWNPLPEGWTVDEVTLSNGWTVDSRCYDALQQMMDACRAEGLYPVVCSAYRTQAKQQNIFDQMKQSLLDQGYSDADAETEAGRQVAVPGTSEHQLGLAVDIVDLDHQLLDESQEQTAVQKCLWPTAGATASSCAIPPPRRRPPASSMSVALPLCRTGGRCGDLSAGCVPGGVYRRQIRRLTGGTRNEIEKVSSSHLYKGVADGCISRNIPLIRSRRCWLCMEASDGRPIRSSRSAAPRLCRVAADIGRP